MIMCCTFNMVLLYSDTRFQNVVLRLLSNQVVYSTYKCKLALCIPTDSDISYTRMKKILIVNKRIYIVVVDGQDQRTFLNSSYYNVHDGTPPPFTHCQLLCTHPTSLCFNSTVYKVYSVTYITNTIEKDDGIGSYNKYAHCSLYVNYTSLHIV
jgi:hypothetical protein